MPPKRGKSKRVPSKNFQKKVTDIVRKELTSELEEKVAVIGATDVSVMTPAIPNGNVFGSSNFPVIFPNIDQGLGQYNERVGNEIRLKSLDLKMLLHFKQLGTDFPENASLGVRVMILKQKDEGSYLGAMENFQGNKLLENGNVIATGPAAFTGNTFNLLQKINREQFSVRYDKVHYVDNPWWVNPGGGQQVFATPSRPKVINHKLTFGKRGLKLTYGNDAGTTPVNFPYIVAIGYASTISAQIPDNAAIAYSYSANASYTDA